MSGIYVHIPFCKSKCTYCDFASFPNEIGKLEIYFACLYKEIKDDKALKLEALRLWICCLNLLIDMGRCTDADQADYHYMIDEADAHHPPYKELIKAAPDIATRAKLLPLPFMGLKAYCRSYTTLTKPLQP